MTEIEWLRTLEAEATKGPWTVQEMPSEGDWIMLRYKDWLAASTLRNIAPAVVDLIETVRRDIVPPTAQDCVHGAVLDALDKVEDAIRVERARLDT